MKKDWLKRCGQIYALGIQHGLSEADLDKYLDEAFMFLYSERKQREIRARHAHD